MSEFFRFPHTPHLAWLAPGSPRDDKVLSVAEAEKLLAEEIVLEEKLDGANLGFSIGPDGTLRVQNRGQYLVPPFTGQFAQLGKWMAMHQDRLFDGLTESLMVFGEWCAARHSLDYDQLPDWWLMFDVYDRDVKRFWSTTRRNELAVVLGVSVVPCLYQGRVTLVELKQWTFGEVSRFRRGDAEGVIVRREDAMWLQQRAKLVRPNFTQAITQHWRKRVVEWNRIAHK
ncbi:RNA ligase family protein [Polaromonas sp.]|uniref:RNA ligase family protein n=1 Tax=Polaromonas sp. TaxID=1869339 RepID=UPI003BB7B504